MKKNWIYVVIIILVGLLYGKYQAPLWIKKQVENTISTNLGVKATVGEAKISLFRGSVELRELEIFNPENFSSEHFASISKIYIRMNLLSIYKKKMDFEEILVSEPTVNVEINNLGKLNLQIMREHNRKLAVDLQKEAEISEDGVEEARFLIKDFEIAQMQINGILAGVEAANIKVDNLILGNIKAGDHGVNSQELTEIIMDLISKRAGEFLQNKEYEKLTNEEFQRLRKSIKNKLKNKLDNQKQKLKDSLGLQIDDAFLDKASPVMKPEIQLVYNMQEQAVVAEPKAVAAPRTGIKAAPSLGAASVADSSPSPVLAAGRVEMATVKSASLNTAAAATEPRRVSAFHAIESSAASVGRVGANVVPVNHIAEQQLQDFFSLN